MYLIMLVTNSLSNQKYTSSENKSKSGVCVRVLPPAIFFSSAQKLDCPGYNIYLITQFLVRQLKLSKLVELLYLAFEIQDCILELGKRFQTSSIVPSCDQDLKGR